MSLPRRLVPVLINGLDEKSPKQAGAPGILDVLQNMSVSKAAAGGGYEMAPRPGTTSQSKTADSGSIAAGKRLGTLGKQLVLLTGGAFYRKATDKWHLVDSNVPCVGVTTSPIVSNSLTATSADDAYANGFKVAAVIVRAAASTNQLVISVYDTTGLPVLSQVVDSASTLANVHVVACGNYVVITYQKASASLQLVQVDLTAAPAIGAPVLASASATVGISSGDLQAIGAAPTQVVLAYLSTATSTYHARLYTPSTQAFGSDVDTTIVGVQTFSWAWNDWSTNELFAAWGGGGSNGISVTKFNASTLATVTTTSYDPTVTYIFSITATRVGSTVTVFATTTPDGTVATSTAPAYDNRLVASTGSNVFDVVRSVALASKAIVSGGAIYMMARYRGTGQGTLFLVQYTPAGARPGTIIGKALPDVAYTGLMSSQGHLPNLMPSTSSSTWLTAGIKNTADVSEAGNLTAYTGAVAIEWKLNDASIDRPIELNGLHLPGALPMLYDGGTLTEDGFPIAAEVADTPVQSGGGVLTALATFNLRFCYAWPDALGNIHRSAPSILVQQVALTSGNQQMTMAIPTLRCTRKSNVSIEVYSSPGNGDASTLFMVTDPLNPLVNDPTVDRVSFSFNLTDTQIIGGQPLYTGGGVLDNLAPPPCRTYVIHRGRLLVGGVDDDPQAVWFSKNVAPGFGVAFSDGLVSRLNATTEAVTGLASMDAYAVAMTPTTTWASGNDYPDDTGAGGVLSFQQYSNQTGVALVGMAGRNDQGLLAYAGAKGAWRMSRGVSYDYVGAAVETDLASFTPAAVVGVPGLSQIRIVGPTTVLVYETLYGTWSKWTYARTPAAFVDAVIWNGALAYLCADGTVVLEDTSIIDDDTHPVPHVVTLSGLNPAQIAGFWALLETQPTGRPIGTGGFTLQATQIFDDFVAPVKSIVFAGTETELNASVEPGIYGKCSRYQVSFSDTAQGPNSSFTLAGVTLLISDRSGLDKLPPARRMT